VRKLAAALTIAGFLAGQGAAAPALAADLPLPPPAKTTPAKPKPKPKAENEFDKLGADCIEATDSCRTYARAADGKFDAKNNIGIACQPKALSCTKRR
jgi:hypothetical protein